MIKDYVTDNIRNVSVVGHGSTGKTSLIESLLFLGGAIDKLGEIDRGTSVSDYDDEEIKRKISIHLTPVFAEYNEKKINLLDTPGVPDFLIDVKSAMKISNSTLFMVDAESGVQIGTEKNWRYADDFKLSRVIIINKLDKEHANINKVLEQIKASLASNTVLLFYPMGQGANLKGVIDLVQMKAIIPADNPKQKKLVDIPAEFTDVIKPFRENLIERACESDDTLLEKFLEGEDVSQDEIILGLKKGIASSGIIPIIPISVNKNIGVRQVLEFIVDFLPSPLNNVEVIGNEPGATDKVVKRKVDLNDKFSAYIFKTRMDQFSGRLSFFYVQSGQLKVNDDILNARSQESEKVAHVYLPFGKDKKEIGHIIAGDIGVLTKLSRTITGDTICNPDAPIQLQAVKIPQPISYTAVKAVNRNEEEKLNEMLNKFKEEDPSFKMVYNPETRQNVIQCMGELQTEIYLGIIREKNKIEMETSVPKVAYRETIKKKAKAQYRHKKQTGGHGQFGEVHIEVEPLPRGSGFEFSNKIVGGSIPKTYIPGVEKGIKEAMEEGVLAFFPTTDVKAILFDGKYHEVDSSEMSFKIAGWNAMKIALKDSAPILLEPIMLVKVYVPDSLMGNVMNDLNGKRARVLGMKGVQGDLQLIEAHVPLAEMLRYSIDLKSITSGIGTFEMEFDHYEELTGKMAEKVIEEAKKLKEEQQNN